MWGVKSQKRAVLKKKDTLKVLVMFEQNGCGNTKDNIFSIEIDGEQKKKIAIFTEKGLRYT